MHPLQLAATGTAEQMAMAADGSDVMLMLRSLTAVQTLAARHNTMRKSMRGSLWPRQRMPWQPTVLPRRPTMTAKTEYDGAPTVATAEMPCRRCSDVRSPNESCNAGLCSWQRPVLPSKWRWRPTAVT